MELQYLLLTLKNHDETLLMGMGQDIRIKHIRGLEAPEYTIHSESNATEDGETKTGSKVGKRIIEIGFGIKSTPNNIELVRRKMIKFFNPKYPTELKINYCYSQGMIECDIAEFKFEDRQSLWTTLYGNITLWCLDPYINDLDNFGKNIASNMPCFAWPLTFAKVAVKGHEQGKIFSYREFSKIVTLTNQGDVPTGIKVTFTALKGAVVNPKITKDSTGEFIEVICDMEMGDVLEIDTNIGHKGIWLNGNKISKQINKQSTYFDINVGDNRISYDATEDSSNLEVRVYYTPKYLGV